MEIEFDRAPIEASLEKNYLKLYALKLKYKQAEQLDLDMLIRYLTLHLSIQLLHRSQLLEPTPHTRKRSRTPSP